MRNSQKIKVICMSRVRTQEDFIKKARETHRIQYDYSQVVYVSTKMPVTIICPVHGPFEQTPLCHLRGQGCPVCGRNKIRIGRDEFIRRAIAIHGNRYDYSRVIYHRKDEKVEIICREHGSFWQTPHSHVQLRQNCPKCAAAEGGRKRRGDNNAMCKPAIKEKVRQTCLNRYGAKTYAESEEGRQRLHDIVTRPEVRVKMESTCQQRYGAKCWSSSDIGHEKLHELMSSVEMRQKIVSGYRKVYGVDHYMKTEEGRAKARLYLNDERRAKIRGSFLKKYGVSNAFLIDSVRAVIYSQRAEIVRKSWVTKSKNGTFNTSKPEESLYRLLCDKFGTNNVIRQYMDKDRYPFCCDFYIVSLDLFIELNANWTHGGHWFDESNPLDLDRLAILQQCAKLRGSRFYRQAIYIWTCRDLLKKRTAEANCLNYLVFWDNDLTDALAWLVSL